jgi:FMN reductase
MKTNALPTIVGLGGSLRAQSYSNAALQAGLQIAQDLGYATQMLDLRQLDLPIYVPDQAIAQYPQAHQASITQLVQAFRQADAMLWATPTYHGSMSGVFKNAIDYLQLLAGDARPYLQGCPIGLISASDPAPLGAMAHCVHELRGWLAPTRLTVDSEDFSEILELSNPRVRQRLQRLVTELETFANLTVKPTQHLGQ